MTAHSTTAPGPDSTTPETGPPRPPSYTTFDDFYTATHARFLAYARRYTTSREQALDAVQDAYTDVLARWDTINNPTAYGTTAVRRNAYAQTRHWERSTPTATPEDTAIHCAEPDPTDAIVLKNTLLTAIRELPPTQRAVVVSRYLKAMTTDEIATTLNITVGTVRAHLSHARRRLRDLITEPPPTAPRPPATPTPTAQPALHTLYDRYADSIYRYISLLAGTGPTAENLTSKTFLQALPHLTAADPETRLIATARALVSHQHHPTPPHHDHAVGTLLAASTEEPPTDLPVDPLLRALTRLNNDQYECIVLRFLQGLTIAESARIMNRTPGALKLLQHRALKNLAQDVDNHPHDPQPADVSRTLHAVAPRCTRALTPHPAARRRMQAAIEHPPHTRMHLTH
ncbi:sigma-70 family RNA polymerase sigma factor [Streptomyces ardesiacus]|uniref:RNA polymerase sigma factor n=2 Tax=Streptomyces TaxID=1883 RepID=UPI0033A9501C